MTHFWKGPLTVLIGVTMYRRSWFWKIKGGQMLPSMMVTKVTACKEIVNRPPNKSVQLKTFLFYISTKAYIVGAQKNRLNDIESVLLLPVTLFFGTC